MPAWSHITTMKAVFLAVVNLFNFKISELKHFDKGVFGFKVRPYLGRDKRQAILCQNRDKKNA